ncbi:MAG: M48 family metalloprotease [Opitutaceae bacterium]|nr:M48 family metalloprotease [Opitutaceae bacterium]
MRGFPAALVLLVLAPCAHGAGTAQSLVATTAEEQGLWQRVAEEQAALDRSGFVLEEPELEDYLQAVVARLATADGLAEDDFSVKLVRDPTLNAFAYPNGRLYIHTGLLARMLNEAQLASVLAHEMTHATHKHALKSQRSLKTKTGILQAISLSAPVAGDFSPLIDLLGVYGTAAAVSGYSKGLETEADEVGWQRMRKCGYDTGEAPVVFRVLMADLSEHARKEPFFFGTHPKLADREKNFARLNAADKKHTGGEKGEERFAQATRRVLLINGELEMRAGRHDAARDQLWRYRVADPSSVRVRWLIGENERVAGAQGDPAEARKLLEEALAMDETFAPAHRSLGILLYRAGELAAAAPHLRRFLDLDRTAHDRAYIEAYLEKCEPTPPPAPPAPAS